MKVIAFTTDVTPIPGLPTSGTALRTFGLIQGLRANGHEVLVSVPKTALQGLKKNLGAAAKTESVRAELAQLEPYAFDALNQNSLIQQHSPDVILCGHWPAMTLTSKPSQPLIIDLAGPHMLERHYQQSPNQPGAMLGKFKAISTADYFIVSGAKQRLYFLSYLNRAAVENPEKKIATITMPLNPSLPTRSERSMEKYPHFVYGGVFLPWQDPSSALLQVGEEITRRDAGSFKLIGGKHPNYKIDEGVYAKLFEQLSKNPRTTVRPMLPYDQFIAELLDTDVAIDLMSWNLERELAVTIRTTTLLWAGVPIIYNNYADLSTLISKYDAGWCIPPDEPEALRAVLDEIYQSPDLVAEKSANAQTLAKECFSWDTAVAPILEMLSAPESKHLREVDIIFDFPDNADFPVSREKSIAQSFVCRVNGLSRVECRIATHNRPISNPLSVSLYELDGETVKNGKLQKARAQRHLVANQEFEPSSLKNNDWLTLDVDPQRASAGKTFVFSIDTDEATPDTSASPWAVKGSAYPLLELEYAGKAVPHAALCLRTTCSGEA